MQKNDLCYDSAYLGIVQLAFDEASDQLGMTLDTPADQRNVLAKIVMSLAAPGEIPTKHFVKQALEAFHNRLDAECAPRALFAGLPVN